MKHFLWRFFLGVMGCVGTASGRAGDAVVKEQARLSSYFGLGVDEYGRPPAELAANDFAVVQLEKHVVSGPELPAARFRGPEQAAKFYPQGYTMTTRFVDGHGEDVAKLAEPGIYGVWITVDAKGGKAFTCRHLLVRLPDGEAEPEDVSQAAALRWLAAHDLGRAWTQDDPSLFTYAAKWWWRMERTAGTVKRLEWFALYPPGYDEGVKAGRRYPVYVDLHGSGATRVEWEKFKADLYFRTFDAVVAAGWVVVLPQSRGQWNPWAVLDVLDQVEATVPVERSRVYVGGHSMGASGTWRLLDAAPGRFAAAVMVAGGNVPPLEKVKRFTGLPLWVVFGERDNPDGQTRSEAMVAAINANGGKALYTRMPGANHMQSRNEFFTRPELWEWLGAQRLEGR